MKFWKQTLVTAILFIFLAGAVVYTSCEKDPCTNLTCYNGGSCGNGKCICPTGYENTQCQTLSVTRYIGTYAGTTYTNYNNSNHVPNNTQEVLDTAYVFADGRGANTVGIYQVSRKPDTLHGYVLNTESTYSIIVPVDSVVNNVTTISITLSSTNMQSNNELNIQSYQTLITDPDSSGIDTSYIQANFVGYKISNKP